MQPRSPHLSLLLTALCLLSPGCDDPVEAEEDEDPRKLACVTPTAGLVLTQDTVLCPGTFPMNIAAGQAAISIAADDVSLTCLGTRITGIGPIGPVSDPNVGIRIDGADGVTVDGCAADHFRYGLVARDAKSLLLHHLVLDDNFTDPSAGWVQDNVQGGGIRLERVVDGVVQASSFARNWNGIELRDSDNVHVQGNKAAHCSNTGATLVGADHNVLQENDFSWAIRGPNLQYPGNWYGVETFDSAGIIVDGGSTDNTVQDNDVTYGGDGLFVRSIIRDECATGNRFIANQTSYSPHNAIESSCDDNQFIANDASYSHYGIWLGRSDRTLVRDNTVVGNLIDGISIQIDAARHNLIDGNTITDSGRAGILVSGREYQAEHDLETHWDPDLANSSHTLIQRNYFADNTEYDLFTTSTRGLVTVSNCAEIDWTGPDILFYTETEVAYNAGGCLVDDGYEPPAVAIVDPGTITAGLPVVLQTIAGDNKQLVPSRRYNWVVQPVGDTFPSGSLPPLVHGAAATYEPNAEVTFPGPGYYDIDVIAFDHGLGGMAQREVTVVPGGTRIGETATAWDHHCTDEPGCTTSIIDVPGGLEGDAVRVVSDAPFGLVLFSPAVGDLNLNAKQATRLGFFVRASNPNDGGWQEPTPIIRLVGSTGTITYTPSMKVLPVALGAWTLVEVPLAGGAGWQVTDGGGTLADIDRVEIIVDTWGYAAFELSIDTLSVY